MLLSHRRPTAQCKLLVATYLANHGTGSAKPRTVLPVVDILITCSAGGSVKARVAFEAGSTLSSISPKSTSSIRVSRSSFIMPQFISGQTDTSLRKAATLHNAVVLECLSLILPLPKLFTLIFPPFLRPSKTCEHVFLTEQTRQAAAHLVFDGARRTAQILDASG